MIKFIYRIDDIHPAMMWDHFWEIMGMFETRQVVPLLGIIPDNQDQTLMFDPPNPEFFSIMRFLVKAGKINICQHGYQHVYTTRQRSINQILYNRVSASEFVGIPYERQYQMIKTGKEILESEGLFTSTWMAPSHTNDRNTFRALKALGFKYVTDGIALYPYEQYGLLFVPQQMWRPKRQFLFNFGVFTVCLHLNDFTEERITEIRNHLQSGDEIIPFTEAVQYPRKWYHTAGNILYKIARAAYHKVVIPIKDQTN